MKLDVHHAGAIGGKAYGAFIATIDAPSHRDAKALAAERYPTLRVVVLPHCKSTAKLERALRQLSAVRRRR